jgi:hypothetical protein
MPELYRYPIAIVLGFLAAMTRLSAVMFLIPVVLYGLIAPRSRGTFLVVVMLLGALGLSTAMFFLPHLDRLLWNVPNYHARRWNDVSVMSTIAETLAIRIPDLIQFFDIYIFLLLPAALLALGERDAITTIRSYVSHNPPLLIVGVGLALFAVSHLAAGGWHIEYFAAAVVSSLPIIAIAFHKMHDLQESSAAKVLLWGTLLTALLVAPARHGVQHISIPGRQLTLQDASEISALISRHSDPSDRVLALQALWAVIGSNRSVLPGLTMSQFSYHDVSREEAQRFGVVNGEIVLEYVNSCAARVIVLTDLDWELFTRTGYEQSIRQALFDRYELVLNKEVLGQQPWNLEVYACAAGDG